MNLSLLINDTAVSLCGAMIFNWMYWLDFSALVEIRDMKDLIQWP